MNMSSLRVSPEKNQAYQEIVADYLHYLEEGCDLSLLAIDDRKNISRDTLAQAKEQQTPILITTGEDKFWIYGNVGDDTWTYINITGTPTSHLNALSFENRITTIKRSEFTEDLTNTLKKVHIEKISSISSRR